MKRIVCAALAACALNMWAASPISLNLRVDKPGAAIEPTMYGVFFEDINYGADGGLYAEMVKNRSFEFSDPLAGWTAFGEVSVADDGPFERNPHYVRLAPATHRSKYTGLQNEGFFGMSLKADSTYRFSVWARTAGSKPGKIRVELVDPASNDETTVLASQTIDITSPEWQRYAAELRPYASRKDCVLRVMLPKPDDAPIDLEHISLFPADTWRHQDNGLRRDLVEALYDLNPGVFRFPGGCIVEGTEIGDRYRWKNTVGPVENRPTNVNRWHFEFPHRFFPDYYQSFGLGFYEYFRLAEDLGADPLPVLNVGMVCQYENPDPSAHVPVDSLQMYIDDALDLIEFANGATDSPWGAVRAQMGHPEPFNLKYLAVGNEQWGPEYVERLEPFVTALRKAHPEIKIIGSSGPSSDGKDFDYLWPEMRRLGVDLVDEHYYRDEQWFLNNLSRYDSYPRKGSKVFAGEYACHGKGKKFNHYRTALLEAAFMTGLERNADVVLMATYAPLFAHKQGWQWRPDLIWFDNDSHTLTSSYYVQQLFGQNTGTRVLPLTLDGSPLAGQEGLSGSASIDQATGTIYIKLVNTSDTPRDVSIDIRGLADTATGAITTLSCPSDNLDTDHVTLTTLPLAPISQKAPHLTLPLPPQSLRLITLQQ